MPPYVKKGPSEAVLRAHELDAAPLESLSPEEQRKRADRERKRTERKAAKEVEAKKEAAERAEKACATREQWWETQRAKLPPKERMEMETLHAQMMEYTSIMREYNQGIAGTDERPQDLEDTKNEVRELHSKYSTTTIVLPQLFWRDKGLFDAIAAR